MQSNQLISSETKKFTTEQIRDVVIREGRLGHAAEVQLMYRRAMRRASRLGRATDQPVAGKTYLVGRESASDELVITYLDGSAPPPDELVIVDANMQAVGKPNPLAEFLDERSVDLGEELTLPAELAAELLSGSLAKQADKVTLKLSRISAIKGQAAAVFAVTIVGRADDQSEPSFQCTGQLSIAIATCRTLQIDMDADVAITEKRGPEMAPFEVTNVGTVAVQMSAEYLPERNVIIGGR